MKNPFGAAFWRGFLSMTAYGTFHSLLASSAVKKPIRARIGERAFKSFFRVGYNAVALGTLAWLLAAMLKKPGEEIYHARGVAKWALRAVGALTLLYAGLAALQVGPGRLSGLGPAARGVVGIDEKDPPESQNPTFAKGAPRGGPFSRHRHPLNFIAPIAFWCFSRGSQSFIGLNTALTLYSVLASYSADAKMRARYGKVFERYAVRTPLLWPRWKNEENR
jgi:uncharacterized membrane protein